jgi:hypothetical protein
MPERMKSHRDIQNEAERLVVLGRAYRAERRAHAGEAIVTLPRVVGRLPDSQVTIARGEDASAGATHRRRERHIEADIEHDELLFRLVERETELASDGRALREAAPEAVMVSRSGFDLLLGGYELVEEERLAEALAPYADRDDTKADAEAIAEVESILETSSLPVADRMRAKAEIIDFLEGRLEPGEFIEHAIDRQRLGEVCAERESQRAEMRLTINSE